MIEVLQQYRDLVLGIEHEINIDEWIQNGEFMLLISLRASLEDALTEEDSFAEEYRSEVLDIDQEFNMILTKDQFDQLEREARDLPIDEWWG